MSLSGSQVEVSGRIPLLQSTQLSSPPFQHPFLSTCLWPRSCYCLCPREGGGTSLAGQPGSGLMGPEMTDPSEHPSPLLPAVSPTQWALRVYLTGARCPSGWDCPEFYCPVLFTALPGSQWPFVGVTPGGRCVSMTCPHAGMPGSGGPSSAATVDPLTTLKTRCIRKAESVRIGVEEPESYHGSAIYDLWAPVSLSVKWGHNTNIATQLWWAQMQIKATFPRSFQLWMPLSSHVVCR